MGNAIGSKQTNTPGRKAKNIIGYRTVQKGSSSAEEKGAQVSALTPADLQWKYYVKTYKEGDPELPDDPSFPRRLLERIQERDFTSDDHATGTYVFYPDRSKAKMWVGQYRCLNPEDLLTCGCGDDCVAGEVMGCFPAGADEELAETDNNEEAREDKRQNSDSIPVPTTCSLIGSCLKPAAAAGSDDAELVRVQHLRGGESYFPHVSPVESQQSHAFLQDSMKHRVAVATGSQFAQENLSSRLNFAQQLYSNDYPAVPFQPRSYEALSTAQWPPFPRNDLGDAGMIAQGSLPFPWHAGETRVPPVPGPHISPSCGQPYQMTHTQPQLLPPVLFSPSMQTPASGTTQPTLVR